jgi:DNA repair exonuclease SbcCD ATPase subunit
MASGSKTKEPTVEPNNDLGKIQEILFGGQVREFEARFERLEYTLQERTTQLYNDLQKQLETAEKNWHKRLASLEEALNDERLERATAQERLAGDLEQTEARLRETISGLNHHVDATFEQLEGARQKDSAALRQELAGLAKQFQRDLEQAVTNLQDQKTDRHSLANLLTSLAQQLSPRTTE